MNEKSIESVRNVITNVWAYVPRLLGGLAVIALGCVVAWIVAKVLIRVLLVLRVDRVIARSAWGRALAKGDVRHTVFGAIGNVAGLLVFLVFLDDAFSIWRLDVLSGLLGGLVQRVPSILIAAIALAAGWAGAAAVGSLVRRSLAQEGIPHARLAAQLAGATIQVLAWTIALVELGIARAIVTGAFLIAFGALALTFALAVGLGSRRAVEAMWEERLRSRKDANPAPPMEKQESQ